MPKLMLGLKPDCQQRLYCSVITLTNTAAVRLITEIHTQFPEYSYTKQIIEFRLE